MKLGTKYGDIGLCLCTQYNELDVIQCRVEVKAVGHSAKDRKKSCSLLTHQCLEFFRQKVKYPYLDLVIFMEEKETKPSPDFTVEPIDKVQMERMTKYLIRRDKFKKLPHSKRDKDLKEKTQKEKRGL